jgi:hypothetical protein
MFRGTDSFVGDIGFKIEGIPFFDTIVRIAIKKYHVTF